MTGAPTTNVQALLERYDVFWLDAFGVLVETAGPLPGAAEFLARLAAEGRPTMVLSNDASRLPETLQRRFEQFGLAIPADRILTSGMVLMDWMREQVAPGTPCIVLGTPDSAEYVRRAGGVPVGFDDTAAEVIVAADDDGFSFLEGIEEVLTTVVRRIDAGRAVRLVLPNPDLVYPKGGGRIGLTSGSVALLLEQGLRVRYGDAAPGFLVLGKPAAPIFAAAARRMSSWDPQGTVMIGDQIGTDIVGARSFGIDAVLVGSGMSAPIRPVAPGHEPTWFLPGLA
jgi:HAD superfamily hydrolase (TIGR01459 family)